MARPSLPAAGETNWGTKLNTALNDISDRADDASDAVSGKASASSVTTLAATVAAIPAPDDAIGTAIGNPTSVTSVALDARTTVGQGITAATAATFSAVQSALTAAASVGTRATAYGTITTSSTLVITSDCDLSQLTINYTGSGVAVQVGSGTSGAGGILWRKNVILPVIINAGKSGTGWAAGTVGVRAVNTFGCTIRSPRIRNFETGYYAYGLGTGNVYNDVQVLHGDNNKRNLVLGAGTAGWCNSNTYHLGSLQHDAVEGNNITGVRQILLETATNIINGNLIIGGSVEGNTAEYHLDCDGLYNRFLEVRWENSTGCRIAWRANSARNVIDYGYAAHQLVETHITGSLLNRVYSTGMSRIVGSTSKAVQWLENTSSSSAAVDAIMDPGATPAGADPATAYRVYRSGDYTKMKRAADVADRMILDHVNGRLYLGDGSAAPTTYLQFDSAGLWKLVGASLYPATDGAYDLGIHGTRWRNIRARSTVITGANVTGSRPSPATGVGAMFYDTTLSKPIWSDGTVWRDATGTTV